MLQHAVITNAGAFSKIYDIAKNNCSEQTEKFVVGKPALVIARNVVRQLKKLNSLNKKLSLMFFLLISVFSGITSSLFGQHLPANSVYQTLKTSDGLSLYTLEMGNRNAEKTFIVIHGGFGAEHSYLIPAILPHIDENHFILFDQRGSLRSAAPDSLITFNNFINDIELIRKEFNLDKISLIAHSNGATIALDYQFHFSEVVEKSILIACPISIIDTKYFPKIDEGIISKYRKELETWQVQVESKIKEKYEYYHLTEYDSLSSIDKTLRGKISYSANHTYLMKDIERTRNAFFNSAVFETLQNNENPESWSKRTSRMSQSLVENSASICIINGFHDFVDPKGHVWQEIDNNLEHLKYVLIPEAGHNIWLDQPDEFSKILEGMLN